MATVDGYVRSDNQLSDSNLLIDADASFDDTIVEFRRVFATFFSEIYGMSIPTATNTPGPTTGSLSLPTTDGISYTSSNVLTNALRGMNVGIAIVLFIIASSIHSLCPKRTTIASYFISIALFTQSLFSICYDLFVLENCYLRVKVIYGFILVNNFSYWVFQADLTYTVSMSHSKSIPGTIYIIVAALAARFAIGINTVYQYTWKVNPNHICSSILNANINLLDKLSDLVYCLLLAALFLYPVVLGYRDISQYAPKKPHESVRNTYTQRDSRREITEPAAPALDGITAGRNWLMRVMMDKGFILVITCGAEILYLSCVFSGLNPTFVSVWNAVFASTNAVLMSIHLLTTAMRKNAYVAGTNRTIK
ncbi:hypothetical protein CcCBS67573_g08755 [Chytriomyces confervae]|uniref:G-protein coupled receptors family 1 profile domain-containing protein n=1 Tax=Chytriomyces confervae TaxID=246404 RepID=A0A507EG22_9FUNG|nr:hypothetical protein CcCBS67573_g08755 [Chytriomyces confervae]